MKRSLTQRGTALVLATVLNAAAGWLLTQQPAAGRSSLDLDTAGAMRAGVIASSAQPPADVGGTFGDPAAGRPAGERAGAVLVRAPSSSGGCVSLCLPYRV